MCVLYQWSSFSNIVLNMHPTWTVQTVQNLHPVLWLSSVFVEKVVFHCLTAHLINVAVQIKHQHQSVATGQHILQIRRNYDFVNRLRSHIFQSLQEWAGLRTVTIQNADSLSDRKSHTNNTGARNELKTETYCTCVLLCQYITCKCMKGSIITSHCYLSCQSRAWDTLRCSASPTV